MGNSLERFLFNISQCRLPTQYHIFDAVLMFSWVNVLCESLTAAKERNSTNHFSSSNDKALNKPPLNEFRFADEKEKVFLVRSSAHKFPSKKRFGWNVTSAQKSIQRYNIATRVRRRCLALCRKLNVVIFLRFHSI